MNVIRGFGWKAIQQYSTYFLKLIFQVVLARILSPNEFGVLAEMLVFITVAEAFANGGFGTALIQKKDADELDYATTITAGLGISAILYLVLFFTAPRIADFYQEAELTTLLRIFGIAIPFSSFNSIQNAYLLKKYETKVMFVASFVSTVISGVVATLIAYSGSGAIALVIQSTLSMVGNVLILQVLTRWKFRVGFSYTRFKSIFSFSWKIVLSGVLGNVLENIYNLFIGKKYSTEVLGYYNRGNSFPNIIVGQLRNAVSTIALPYLSNNNDDKEILLANTRKITHLSVLVMFPMAAGLAAVADALIEILLTEKWLPCVFFLQLECIFYGCLPIAASLSNAIISVGRSDLCLKVEIIKLILTLLCVSLCGVISVEIVCVLRVSISVLIILIMAILSAKDVGYKLTVLMKDIGRPLVFSLMMGGVCLMVGRAITAPLLRLFVQVLVGIAVYGIEVFAFAKEDANAFMGLLSKAVKSRKDVA